MTLRSEPVRNLFSGVSQQPHTQRDSSNLNAQMNALVYQGRLLAKRPGSTHIAKLTTATTGDPFIFTVNRSASEKYLVVVVAGTISVYNWFTGAAITVDSPDGLNYLQTAPDGFREVTVGDRTVLINRNTTVTKGTTLSPAGGEASLVVVRQGNFGTNYSITVNSTTVTFLTNKSSAANAEDFIGTDTIATSLFNSLAGNGAINGLFTFSRAGSTIAITPVTSGQVYTVRTADGLGDEGMSVMKGSVQRFSDLPPQAPDGIRIEVRGDESVSFDNFWVRYDAAKSVWMETVAPLCVIDMNTTTLPHTLQYKGAYFSATAHGGLPSSTLFSNTGLALVANSLNGKWCKNLTDGSEGTVLSNTATSITTTALTGGGRNTYRALDMVEVIGYGTYFLFKRGDYAKRTVGDTLTNPDPSFVGQRVRDAFVTQGRLGFVTGKSLVQSRTATPFDFFHSTVVQTLPDAPIDITETLPSASRFHAVTEWDNKVIVWTELAQYELKGEPAMTPQTVSLKKIAQYQNLETCRPIASGSRMFFVGFISGLTKVLEFATFGEEELLAAESLTEEIPTFIQGSPVQLEGDDTAGILFVFTRVDTATHLYVCTFVLEQARRVQQSWGRWVVGDTQLVPILSAAVTGVDPFSDA